MIDIKYLKYVFSSAVLCVLAAIYMWFRSGNIDIGLSVLCFVAGMAFTSLVVIRMPVFRLYYCAQSLDQMKRHRDYANRKAAPVMVGLFAGACIGACLYLFGVKNLAGPSFIGALSAAVISIYHEKW